MGVDRESVVSKALVFVFSIIIVANLVGAVTCYCSSCTTCTAALDNPTCTKVVLTQDIHLTSSNQTCINNPPGFRNKVFDCQGHGFYGPVPANLDVTKWATGTIAIITSNTYPPPIVDVADVIENCKFVNTTLGINVLGVSNLTIENCSSYDQDLFVRLSYIYNISIIDTTSSHTRDFLSVSNAGRNIYFSPVSDPSPSVTVKNAKIIAVTDDRRYSVVGWGGAISILLANNVVLSNISFINLTVPTYSYIYYGQDVGWSTLSNWKCVNCSKQAIMTWDFLFSKMENMKLENTSFKPIYTLSHDQFVNLSLDDIDIHSSVPSYPPTNPTILWFALAYSSFKNIKTHGFATRYAYKCNFTNITVYNGTGLVLTDAVILSLYPGVPLQYLISWGNRFSNITLLNNYPYDFYVLSPLPCVLLGNNYFSNIKSVGGKPLLILSATGKKITGNYAEIFACVNDTTFDHVDVSGSPFLRNDGIVIMGEGDILNYANSIGNAVGLTGSVSFLKVYNSHFDKNIIGIAGVGKITAVNITADNNNETGLSTLTITSANFINSSFKNNGIYDIEATQPVVVPSYVLHLPGWNVHYSSAVCDGKIIFKNEKLSGNRGLGIFNTSTTYKNKEYSEGFVCGKNILLDNITIVGNSTLKNNGLLVLNSSYVSMNNIKANDVYKGVLLYDSNHTTITNSTFSNDQTNGVEIRTDGVWSSTLGTVVYPPGYNTLKNITTEYDDIGVYVSSTYNTLNNIPACFDKKVSFYFDGHSSNNVGADNTGNVTDLGTNPGFSADAGICYLSLLKPLFVPPTPANNSILSSTSITLNATSADPTLTNITLNLYNNTGLVKSVVCTSSPCSYSFTGLKLNQNYYFNATACDTEKQCASTGTHTTYLSPTTCALVLVVKNHLNKPLYIDAVKLGSKEYDVGHVLLLPYQTKTLKIENNGFCQYLGRVVFLDMTLYFSDASHMTYEVSGEVALNS